MSNQGNRRRLQVLVAPETLEAIHYYAKETHLSTGQALDAIVSASVGHVTQQGNLTIFCCFQGE